MPSPLTEPLFKLAEAWRTTTRSSRRRVAAVVVTAATVAALLLARHGTGRARLGAGGLIVLSGAAVAAWSLVERRRMRRPEGIVRGLARRVDPERADRALRALSLLDPEGGAADGGTSVELARLHVARALAGLPSDRIVGDAARFSGRLAAAALGAAICVGAVVVANTWSIAEGADVLVSSHGKAPLAMRWLDEIELTARPPEYLHEDEVHEVALLPLILPYGTQVTIRGVPTHAGRRLLLTDGTTEIPFVDDGAGAQVARWPLTQTVTLHCVARFGDVVIPEPDELAIRSTPDLPPVVALEGAPRTARLVELTEDLTIKYDASDDHGLREVDLVLRSGIREERRVLSRLEGETKTDRGGLQLRLRDPFFRKSHAPIEVTVEAKDNDPLTGPKWGKSPAITLVPPDVGEPEARRLDALRALRDALVDTLAWRISGGPPAAVAARKDFVDAERQRADGDDKRLDDTLAGKFGGVAIPQRLRAIVRTQAQRTRKAVDRELRAPSPTTHATVVQATERYVLVVDAVIRGLGVRDSRDSARQLADVADELALGASLMRESGADDSRARGAQRMDAATTVLAGGGRVMLRLGSLGRDLGEIVDTDLLRVKRARDADDGTHAELAARDLAARLREPDPSFGARGTVGRAGGESGGAEGAAGDSGGDTGQDVERAQAEAEQDLERLTSDHAGEIGKMEQALAAGTSDDELQALRDEAKKHAENVRDAVRSLPSVGMGSDSWTSKGAAARELAEQMARSLEAVHPDEAVESGRNSLGALDEATKMLKKDAWIEDPDGDVQRQVDGVRRKLEAEEQWARDQLAQMRRRAAERARPTMEQGGEDEEKMADRARDIADKARDRGAMTDKQVESVENAERAAREAARALKQGDAEKGLDRQREAQRDLEAAQTAPEESDDQDSQRPGPHDGGQRFEEHDHVVIPDKGVGPEDFRRRVVRGLDQPSSGKLKDAVRRYAEGLLR